MKILFIGNQGNTGYRFIKWLREAGVDARLIFPHNFDHPRSYPEWEDPTLRDHYPDWITTYREKRYPYLFLNPRLKRLARHYDLILTAGFHVLPVLSLDKPVVLLPVGRELTQMPFGSDRLVTEIQSFLYRKRIRKISRVLTDQEDCIWAARLLGIGDRIVRFPFLTDALSVERNINDHLRKELCHRYREYDAIFFNPSRKNLDPNRVDYKGTDKLMRAYRRFIDGPTRGRFLMVCGLHGNDTGRFKQLVSELELDNHIEYTGHLSLPDLHAWFSLENVVVFDQFNGNLDALGGIQREAMALGRRVVSSTDTHAPGFVKAYGPDCPLLPAFNEQEILDAMMSLTGGDQHALSNDSTTREWIMKHVHYESRIGELIELLREVSIENPSTG